MPQEKVALITGVSSGIGRTTVILLSTHGFQVFGTMRTPAEIDRQLGDVQVVPLDVREAGSVRSCIQAVLDHTGRIDVLVNNAGYTLIGSLEETSVEEARNRYRIRPDGDFVSWFKLSAQGDIVDDSTVRGLRTGRRSNLAESS
jgi:NAD(P)-dependent dehydrogenase (short-subunit alcohol dehydrogenase family)